MWANVSAGFLFVDTGAKTFSYSCSLDWAKSCEMLAGVLQVDRKSVPERKRKEKRETG